MIRKLSQMLFSCHSVLGTESRVCLKTGIYFLIAPCFCMDGVWIPAVVYPWIPAGVYLVL